MNKRVEEVESSCGNGLGRPGHRRQPEKGGRTAASAAGADVCHAAACDAKMVTRDEAPVGPVLKTGRTGLAKINLHLASNLNSEFWALTRTKSARGPFTLKAG